MRNKIVVSILLFALIVIINNIVSVAVNPEVSTSLTLEQMENPSVVTDTAIRSYNQLSQMLWPALLGCWLLSVVFIFRKDLRRMMNEES